MPQPPALMRRYIALLRAINVGGHVVKMEDLRRLFAALEFANVETFIASGNVIFESPVEDAHALERQIERHLREALGYEVGTFIRSPSELAAIAQYQPFPAAETAGETTLYITFLPAPPSAAARQKLLALQTAEDQFHIQDRELYWLRQGRISDSPLTGALLEKTIGLPATMRNSTTVRKLAAKYAAPPPSTRA